MLFVSFGMDLLLLLEALACSNIKNIFCAIIPMKY